MSTNYRYQQLEHWLIQGIHQQRWSYGERLPSIRVLCQEHHLSKSTVIHSLLRLEAQGLIQAKPKSGYFVTFKPKAASAVEHRVTNATPKLINQSDLWLDIMQRSASFDLLPELQAGDPPPGIIAMHRALGRSLRSQRGERHQYYDDPAGDHSFREQLSLMMAKRSWAASVNELCITSGCQHALFLALQSCCQPHDIVAVESPCFYGVLQLLQQLKLQVIEVPTSPEEGLNVEALSDVLNRWNVTACVVSPNFSTPSGALMPLSSRVALLELAEKHDLAIIEDDIYAELSFGRTPEPLKAMDRHQRVILCSSFSKTLSRDIRLGWISGGRWHEQIKLLKLTNQIASSRFMQQGIAHFIADGDYFAHLRRQKVLLKQRRDRLMSLLADWDLPVKWTLPQGGLTVWIALPNESDSLQCYFTALNEGITITPGVLFSVSGRFNNYLRISFAHEWDSKRENAMVKLGRILKR